MKNSKLRVLIDERLSALHGTPESKERIMNNIRGEKIMKKKLRFVPVIAALIILVLSTIALAMSTNLFGLFTNRYANKEQNAPFEEAAENAVLSTDEPSFISTTGWIDVDSTFFDGQKLMVAYKLEDRANIAETWKPMPDEIEQMSQVSGSMLPMFEQKNDSVSNFYSNYNAGIPCGLHVVVTSRLDHTYTEDGIDLMFADSGSLNENGAMLSYVVFDELPKEVQVRDVVNFALRFSQTEHWYWYDGERLFVNTLSSEDHEKLVMLTAKKRP